jgi:hypothetical protein
MPSTVVWVTAAQAELARIWTTTKNRPAVQAAADALDRESRTNPDQKGLPLRQGVRYLHIPPLEILFVVSLSANTVKVTTVKETLASGNGATGGAPP